MVWFEAVWTKNMGDWFTACYNLQR